MSSPHGPYGDRGGAPQGPPSPQSQTCYGPPAGADQPPYPQQSYRGHVAAKKGIEVDRILLYTACVVLGLYILNLLYGLTQSDEYAGDLGDRFFGGMPTLGTGVFSAGILLAVSGWFTLRKAGD